MSDSEIPVVALLSGWGTGSTAVAGFLDRCGAHSCPPHLTTNDPRTPVAYEPEAYREALMACIDEMTLQPKGKPEAFVAFFETWLAGEREKARAAGSGCLVLKHPLQTFVLPALDRIARPRYVVVTRPFADIERTRERRRWHATLGKAGARSIYGTAYSWLQEHGRSYLGISYAEFRSDAALRRLLLEYAGLEPDPEQLQAANDWLR